MEKYLHMDRIYEGMNRFQWWTCGRILAYPIDIGKKQLYL